MDVTQLPYWLALNTLTNISYKQRLKLSPFFKELRTLFTLSASELKGFGFSAELMRAVLHPDWAAIEMQLAFAKEPHCHLLTLDDLTYPQALREIATPPFVLFAKGDITLLPSIKQLAIVGSRHPTPHGKHNAYQFAYHLAKTGWVITSGLALGVDGTAHQAALDAKGRTIAVMGTGLDTIYPSAHQALAEQIVTQGGLLICEFPLGSAPKRAHFPQRNRIISGLCRGILVVEAAIGSGSLITARHALEQNREVFAIPGSIHNPVARGCHQLIKEGAKLVESAQDILEELALLVPQCEAFDIKSPIGMDKICASVLECTDFAPTSIDFIVEQLGLTAQEVSSMLLMLEMQGYVESQAGAYLRIK